MVGLSTEETDKLTDSFTGGQELENVVRGDEKVLRWVRERVSYEALSISVVLERFDCWGSSEPQRAHMKDCSLMRLSCWQSGQRRKR